jgi:hypothetical protein
MDSLRLIAIIRSLPTDLGGLGIPRFSWIPGDVGCLNARAKTNDFLTLEEFFPQLNAGSLNICPISIGALSSPVDALLAGHQPVVPPVATTEADSNILSLERRDTQLSIGEMQYVQEFNRLHRFLCEKGFDSQAAWLLSSTHPAAGAWISAGPGQSQYNPQLSLTAVEHRLKLRRSLLLPPIDSSALPTDPVCCCDLAVNLISEPFHYFDCRYCGYIRIGAHNRLQEVYTTAVGRRLPAVNVTVQPIFFEQAAPHIKVIADLQEKKGEEIKILDFVICSPTAPTHRYHSQSRSTHVPDAANLHSEERKRTRYSKPLLDVNKSPVNLVSSNKFVPFAVEATGRVGPAALAHLQSLFPCNFRGDSYAETLLKLICITVAKFHAQADSFLLHKVRKRRPQVPGAT